MIRIEIMQNGPTKRTRVESKSKTTKQTRSVDFLAELLK